MKIIGTLERAFLVSATGDELARLDGFDGDWYRERAGRGKIRVGLEVDVNTLYLHHVKIKNITEALSRAKALVDGCSSGLSMADTIIKDAAVEPPKEGA